MPSSPYVPAREQILEGLNDAQRAAVTHSGGALLVVAGAGTGKTRVLTRRVAWLVAGGLPGESLLAITFTNKAARVLAERLQGLPGAAGVWAGTFHAFGASLLRRYGDRIGIDRGFTVLDRDDQRRIVQDLGKQSSSQHREMKPAEVVAMISHVKNGGAGPAPLDLTVPSVAEAFGDLHRSYQERLRVSSLLDFDDLLLLPLRALRESEEAADAVRRRYAHVLVDEYQDTNVVQRDLLLEVLGGRDRVTVVGDPDQSIYRWRGAAIRNILDFAEHVPGARTVLLEQNYRSTKRILAAAEAVISRNRQRHEKRLFTDNPDGHAVEEIRAPTGTAEADAVASVIDGWRRSGRLYGEVAVFYRVNSFSRGLELALRSRGIPYVVVAGVEFFQRREVKDVLAYARLVQNPHDEAAFLRVVNVPRRGVGDGAVQRLQAAATSRGTSLFEAARSGVTGLSPRAARGLADFVALLEGLHALPRAPVAGLLQAVADRSGYVESLADAGEAFGEARSENVTELLTFAAQLEQEEPETDLRAFLERTALVSDQDAYDAEQEDRVNLMSVHAAKGLEFPLVIVAGVEDGLFPHSRSDRDPAGAEEERRLFYVAMTRAMERLVLTHAAWRQTFRSPEMRSPSPFLYDIPREARSEGSPEADVVRECAPPFGVGDRVRHPVFGEGLLEATQGSGSGTRVTIDFDAFGRKTLLLGYATLERVT